LRQRPASGFKFLVAVLAFFGAAAVWSVPASHTAAGITEQARAAAGETTTASLTYSGFHSSNAIIGSNPLSLRITAEGNTPILRYAMRGGRLPKALEIDRQTNAAAASRARIAVLSYLEFATTLAYARAGTAAYRSTAPPPALTC
jgi:hypothetical protein